VEAVIEGQHAEIEHFIEAIRQEMHEYLRGVDSQTSPGTGEFLGFEVRS
jgi:hypothetical protein